MPKSLPVFFLLILLVGTVCNSMAVSFMGFYIVDSLDQEPWSISVYTGLFAITVIVSNRTFAKRMDQGSNPFLMIGLAASGYLVAATALTLSPGFLTVVTVGVIGFGIGSSSMSTMFSIGGVIADRKSLLRLTGSRWVRLWRGR